MQFLDDGHDIAFRVETQRLQVVFFHWKESLCPCPCPCLASMVVKETKLVAKS